MKSNFRYIFLIAIIAFIVVLAGCSQTAENEAAVSADEIEYVDNGSGNNVSMTEDGDQEELSPSEDGKLKIMLLTGESSIGAAYFTEENSSGNTSGSYSISLCSNASYIADALLSGEADIGYLPIASAARLYNESDGNICIAVISEYSSLYMISRGSTANSIYDLVGRTVYVEDDGRDTPYIMEYLLQKTGYVIGQNVFVEYMDSDEIVSRAINGEIELAVLDAVSSSEVLEGNSEYKNAFRIYDEWASEFGSTLTQGCIAVRSDTVSDEDLEIFLSDYEKSINYMSNVINLDSASSLSVTYGGISSESIASSAIQLCDFEFMEQPNDMLDYLTGIYMSLYKFAPESIGGTIPDDAFYR